MRKTFMKLLASLMLVTAAPSLSSCSFIFGGDEGYQIQNVATETDPNGDTVLTITFTDETKSPLVVTLPKGLSGKDGVGIRDVQSTLSDDEIVLTITYTDTTVEPTVLSFPILRGEDGKGISSVDVKQDEETGNTILVFTYTDGTTSGDITIPKAQDGKDGVGIATIFPTYDEETKNFLITITYTDGSDPTIVAIPPSQDGVGISFISYSDIQSDDENYGIIISYTDGTTSILRIPRPQSSHWYYGDVTPSSTIGVTGDYYLNTTTGDVYNKADSGWGAPLFSMKGTGTTQEKHYCTIYFDANGGTFAGGENIKFLASLEVGTNIPLTGDTSFETIGIPSLDGREFTGWYTSPEDEALSGQFTDLTPIYGEQLTLYAHWEVEG